MTVQVTSIPHPAEHAMRSATAVALPTAEAFISTTGGCVTMNAAPIGTMLTADWSPREETSPESPATVPMMSIAPHGFPLFATPSPAATESVAMAARAVRAELDRVEMIPVRAPSIHTPMALPQPNAENAKAGMVGIARTTATRGIERLRLKVTSPANHNESSSSGNGDAG